MKKDSQTVADEVTDEMLSNALNGEEVKEEEAKKTTEVVEEPQGQESTPVDEPTPAPEVPEKPLEQAEDEDQKERSRLGRKVKGLESKLDLILNKIESVSKPPYQQDTEEDLEMIDTSTAAGMEKYLAAKEEKLSKSKATYQENYASSVMKFESVNPDLHEEVMGLMTSNNYSNPFNVVHTGNPGYDARINYLEAKAAILANKTAKPKLPGKGETVKVPGNPLAGGNRMSDVSKPVMPKLDEETQDYVNFCKKQGMTDEEIVEALE